MAEQFDVKPGAEEKSHVWWGRLERTSLPIQFEFGNPLTKREASDRIAAHFGLDELPTGASVSREKLEKLSAQTQESKEPAAPTAPAVPKKA